MAIEFTTTDKISKFKKVLVYGKSGIGKTRLQATIPKLIMISSENKTESLAEEKIPVIVVKTIQDFEDALNLVVTKKYTKKFYICGIDSISDIAEVAIAAEKSNHNDPRKAYGVIQDRMLALLRQIRDSDDIHFYVIAKAKMVQNENNVDQYMPKMPGKQMGPELPYIFDFVFPLKYHGDEEDDDSYIYLQTTVRDDAKWEAKDCSGKLNPQEPPDLKKLFKKLTKK